MKKSIVFYFFVLFPLIWWGTKTPQKNNEELFLSDTSLESFKEEINLFGRNDPVIVTGLHSNNEDFIKSEIEKNGGEFYFLNPEDKKEGIFVTPNLEDEEKLDLFNRLREVKHVSFAGGPYTNALLAEMSLRIKNNLFPFLFGGIFLLLFFLVRSFNATLLIFMPSLVSVGIALVVARIFYGHTTILTTLSPLIGLILTLGCELHIIYGLSCYREKSEFWKNKKKPLLLMMLTTCVGFYSLGLSELTAVREFGMVTGMTLTLSFLMILLMVRFIPTHTHPKIYAFKNRINLQKKYPLLGGAILLGSCALGLWALGNMPRLVEAVYFFPMDHPIHQGVNEVSKALGGTPQFEVSIQKRDSTPWSWKDTQFISQFEDDFPVSLKRISPSVVVKNINLKYLGKSILPVHEVAFLSLLSKAPPLIGNHLLNDHGLKWIFLSRPLSLKERIDHQEKINQLLKKLPENYKAQVGGLSHWITQSQAGLITSLIKSFSLSLILVTLTFGIFTPSFKKIMAFLFLNLSSILGGFFLFKVSGLTLNVSSVMTASIAMGLVVDSTIHLMFLDHDKHETRATYNSIIIGHLVLFFSFGFLVLTPFLPIRDFALGLILMLFVGLSFDLWVLPMIISMAKKNN